MSRRRAVALPSVLAGLAGVLCCQDGEPSAEQEGETARDIGKEVEPEDRESTSSDAGLLEALAAIGYVEWGPNDDEGKRGVVLRDSRACPGYNLYSNSADRVVLTDLDGEVVHEWNFPGNEGLPFADLLVEGRLVLGLGADLALVEFDGTVCWRSPLNVHHDVAREASGEFLVLTRELHEYHGRSVLFDGIARVSADGETLSHWSSYEHLAELRLHHPSRILDRPPRQVEPENKRYDYYHTNCIEILSDTQLGRQDARFRAGNLLLCLRNANCVLVLDQDDYSVQWSWGVGEIQGPHMPTLLADGHLLLFDNGPGRGASRVLELRLPTAEIVWRFEGSPPESFYSRFRGSNQRLCNGNTLICESERGHAFEVTHEGDVVWDYWNPDVVEGKRRLIYRLVRHSAEVVEPLLAR